MRAVLTTNQKFTIMQAYPLHEGSYSVGTDKKFIPFDPLTDDKQDRKGSLFIHVQPFLIKHANDLIVIDTGLGQYNEDNHLTIHSNIQKLGFDPADVTLVLMSHLHSDHASGMAYEKNGKFELTFQNAEYIIQRSEWEEAHTNSSPHLLKIFDVLQRSGQIHFVEGDGKLNDFISYELSGAHTKYHQVFHLNTDSEHYFYGGDEWPEPEQALRKFAAKYDYDGRKAMELRESYATEAADNHWICLFYHAKANAIAKIAKQDDSFRIVPV